MKSISVREMKAHRSRVKALVANEEVRGKPTVQLVPAGGRKRVVWDDHLATAIKNVGVSAEETARRDREGRW